MAINRYVGVGRENVSYQTAAAAVRYEEAKMSLKPDLGWIIPSPISGRAFRTKTKGDYLARGTIGPFDLTPDGIAGDLLYGCLGGATPAQQGGTAAYLHTFKGADTCPSYTFRRGLDIGEFIDAGGLVESVTLQFKPAQPVQISAEIYSTVLTTSGAINATPTFPSVAPITLQDTKTVFTLGGTDSKALIYDLSVTFKNNWPINERDLTGRTFSVKRYGQREVTAKASIHFDNSDEFTRFKNGTEFTLIGSAETSQIAGIYNYKIGVELRKCVYLKDAVPDITAISEGLNIVNAPIQAFYDTTGSFNAEGAVTLQNAITAY